jgi:DNA-binding transcriptional LysR family regulator
MRHSGALEDELGAELVDRSSRRITLTPAGQRLRPEVRRLLDMAGGLPALARSSSATIPNGAGVTAARH